jgi:choline-sulfatase
LTSPARSRHYQGVRISRGRVLSFLLVAVAMISIAAAAWRVWPRSRPLNLLVITLDTTRADRIGAYGYADVQTPVLDGLARDGVLFEQAMTSAPLTLPAHGSIFTGTYPPQHGLRDNGGFFLGPDQTTLAEVLKGAGFETGAAVGAYVLDSKWGLDQGFSTYLDDFDLSNVRGMSLATVQRPGNEVVDKALGWLERARTRRFFAWIHFYDPHTPYAAPEPFKTTYARHPYDGEIAFVDAQIGRVIAFLREHGLLDRTIIAVIGDHGEGLGQHGEAAHGFFIYESSTRVPFIVRAPAPLKMVGRRIADPVRSVDLMPTVLDLLGVAAPNGLAGTSLVPLMSGRVTTLDLEGYAEAMYPLHHFGWSDLKALRAGRYKLIDAPRPELYDIEQDPLEQHDLFGERRALGDTMLARLRAREAEMGHHGASAGPAVDVDPEVRARLAALGYVGSFVATSATPRTDRADPKDKIGIFNLMTSARDVSKDGPDASSDVIGMLKSVVSSDPDVIDAWFMLGNEYYKARQYDVAITNFRRALALKPDYDLAIINLANCYRAQGHDDAALDGYERYLTVDPKNAYVWYQVGEIYLDRGDVAAAEERFVKALEIDESVAPAKNALGVVAFKRGDLDGAERNINAAIAMKPDVRLAHYNLALVAEERNDLPRAESEYKQELEHHPTAFKASFNLGRLYERLGRTNDRISALKQSIEANPGFAEGHLYLAKAYLDAGVSLDEAIRLARRGLELSPEPDVAPLGHFVIAGVLLKQGRPEAASRELEVGRALEAASDRKASNR